MKIKEAIKIINRFRKLHSWLLSPELKKALRLSEEALKYFEAERQRRGATQTMWLPGETKE